MPGLEKSSSRQRALGALLKAQMNLDFIVVHGMDSPVDTETPMKGGEEGRKTAMFAGHSS